MTEDKVIKNITIKNRLGLHARAASKFVQVANNFDAEVMVEKDGHEVNGKSIMGILILAAACGTELTISAYGAADAPDAVNAICELIDNNFDEED